MRTPAGRPGLAVAIFGAAMLAGLAAPFLALAAVTDWRAFALRSGDVDAIRVSLVLSLVALGAVAAFGTPLAWWLARAQVRGKAAAEALVLLPLLAPPLALGILLASLYGPYAPVGALLRRLGIELTNNPAAFVLAQVYAAAPYYIVAARAAFEAVPPDLERVALTLGKAPWQVFWLVTLPLGRLGLASGLAFAWVRAIGEFGAVLILAYYPQGIPVKIWVNLQDEGLQAVYPLLWAFLVLAMPIPLVLGIASRRGTAVPC